MYAYVMGLNVYWLIYTNTKLVQDSLYLGNMKNNYKIGEGNKNEINFIFTFWNKNFCFSQVDDSMEFSGSISSLAYNVWYSCTC